MNKKIHKPQKLQRKLFTYYLIIPVLALGILGSFFYYYVSRILIERESEAINNQNTSLRKSVDEEVKDLDSVSANLNYFNRKIAFFSRPEDLRIDIGGTLTDTVMAMNTPKMNADQINLYAENGYTAAIGTLTKNMMVDLSAQDWYEAVIEKKGSVLIGVPYYTKQYALANASPEWYLSVYRAGISSNGRVIGAIETSKRCKILFQDLNAYTRKTPDAALVCVTNADGDLIYPYDVDDSRRAQLLEYCTRVQDAQGTTGEIISPVTDEKCTFALSTSSYSGWSYITIQRNRVILRPLILFIQMFLLIMGITLLGTIMLSWLLARNMIKPLKHLKHIIQRMGLETLGEEPTDNYGTSYEELQELYVEFQKMSHSLKESMEELEVSRQLETRSRVLALQAQMNPHFYYNTLSCISILAENGHVDEVSMMCQTLSQIMRYITNTGTVLVTLGDEINHIRQYMYCMKIRYQDSLDFSISVDPVLCQEKIPKLVIQPLVENAIKYGTDCLPPWSIRITGVQTDELWYIRIEDSGNGFSEEKLTELLTKLHTIDINNKALLDNIKIGGMGLVNVYLRWATYCKGDAYFRLGNTEDGHHAFVEIGRKTK